MNISANWLREWANPEVSDTLLAEKLTQSGLEVDSVSLIAPPFAKVVVGNVVSCEKHPNADKLNLCQVDIGQGENLQIVCGASNVGQNLKVALATVGAKLPNGLTIKAAEIRGMKSFGMICSAAELGLTDTSDGIMVLENSAIIGQDIRAHLDLDDAIIELDIAPNRGDCFSILGVSREVCIHYNLPKPALNYNVAATLDHKINAIISHKKACPKYLTRVIKGIDNTVKTPQWMIEKLKRCGQQTHSAVVDITNFVLFELGQPMHAFDLAKISGDISVRMANVDEKITLLNEQIVSLDDSTLLIADEQKPLAMAGIMGGAVSSTQAESVDILLESAFFDPILIAGKARKYGLHTESSLRFERGVDFNITEIALQRATQLILEICGGQCAPVNACIDLSSLPKLEPITISKEKIANILGFELDADWILAKFNQLDFKINAQSANAWQITPPSFRFDIRQSVDLIEELARLYGYDKIPIKKQTVVVNMNDNSTKRDEFVDKYKIALSLVNRGYQEVINYSFIAHEYQHLIDPQAPKITLSNPISKTLSVMRSSLWAGLLYALKTNQRRGYNDIKLFEIGLCFAGSAAKQQVEKIGGVISGNRFAPQWADATQPLDFFDAKADVEALFSGKKTARFDVAEHPALQIGQSAKIYVGTLAIGWIGALCPSVQKKMGLEKCYLFELDLASLQYPPTAKYQAVSAYQRCSRDLALLVDAHLQAEQLLSSIRQMQQTDFVDVNLFDVYSGEALPSGKKSIALNLSYQSFTQTLTDDKVNEKIAQVLKLLKQKYGAEQR